MENQHRKISGYRELTADEVALMNEIKGLGVAFELILNKVQTHIAKQHEKAWEGVDRNVVLMSNPPVQPSPSDASLYERLINATPERFAALAKTEIQTGLMYLTRAVAQPTTF